VRKELTIYKQVKNALRWPASRRAAARAGAAWRSGEAQRRGAPLGICAAGPPAPAARGRDARRRTSFGFWVSLGAGPTRNASLDIQPFRETNCSTSSVRFCVKHCLFSKNLRQRIKMKTKRGAISFLFRV